MLSLQGNDYFDEGDLLLALYDGLFEDSTRQSDFSVLCNKLSSGKKDEKLKFKQGQESKLLEFL